MNLEPENMTLEELKIIYDEDNQNGDCDCSFCRYYRHLIKDDGALQSVGNDK